MRRNSSAANPAATSSGVKSRTPPRPNNPYIVEPSPVFPLQENHGAKPGIIKGRNAAQPGRRSSDGSATRLRPSLGIGGSDRDLSAHLDDTAGRNLEIVGGVIGRAGEPDIQPVLPARHA